MQRTNCGTIKGNFQISKRGNNSSVNQDIGGRSMFLLCRWLSMKVDRKSAKMPNPTLSKQVHLIHTRGGRLCCWGFTAGKTDQNFAKNNMMLLKFLRIWAFHMTTSAWGRRNKFPPRKCDLTDAPSNIWPSPWPLHTQQKRLLNVWPPKPSLSQQPQFFMSTIPPEPPSCTESEVAAKMTSWLSSLLQLDHLLLGAQPKAQSTFHKEVTPRSWQFINCWP